MRRYSMVTVLGVVVALMVPAAAGSSEPDSEGPVAGLVVVEGYGQDGHPFTGERFFLQSPAQPTGSDRTGWQCRVDPGEGGERDGYWRAQRYAPTAPCALAHTYAAPGTYAATMTVTDPQGRSVTTTLDLEVVDRPTEVRSGLTEGDRVDLPGAPSGGTWRVAVPNDPYARDPRCILEQPTADAAGWVSCFDEGRFQLHLDATDGAHSRALVLEQHNGAPAPEPARLHALQDDGDAGRAVRGAVHVGEVLLVEVHHGDPGVPTPDLSVQGDQVTCDLDMGDGDRVTGDPAYFTLCTQQLAWQRPGRYDLTVVARDDDGAEGTSTRTVKVAYRPAWLSAHGTLDDASVLASHGGLGRSGPFGAFALDTAAGQEIRQAGEPRIEVLPGSVSLQVPVTVDGVTGYQARVSVARRSGEVTVVVWSPTETLVYARGVDMEARASHGRYAARSVRRHTGRG